METLKQAAVLTTFRGRVRLQHDAYSLLGRLSIAFLVPALMLLFQEATNHVLEAQIMPNSTATAIKTVAGCARQRAGLDKGACTPVYYAPAHPNVERLLVRASAYAGLEFGVDVLAFPGTSGAPPYNISLVNVTAYSQTHACTPGGCVPGKPSQNCLPCAFVQDNVTIAEYLVNNPGSVDVVAHFVGSYLLDSDASYVLYYNDTRVTGTVSGAINANSEDGVQPAVAFKRALDQAMLEQAAEDILHPSVRVARFNLTVNQRSYPVPQPRTWGYDAATTNGAQWYFLVSAVWIVEALTRIVGEKERHRRLGLHLAGFRPLAYWIATFADVFLTSFIACVISLVISYACGIGIMINTHPGAWLLSYGAFCAASASFVILLATVISSERAANVTGAALLVAGFLVQFALNPAYGGSMLVMLYANHSATMEFFSVLLNLYPALHYSKLFSDITTLSGANWDFGLQLVVRGRGFQWSDMYAAKVSSHSAFATSLNSHGAIMQRPIVVQVVQYNGDDVMLPRPLDAVAILFGECLGFFLLALVLDAALPAPHTPGWSWPSCYAAFRKRVLVHGQRSAAALGSFLPRWDLSINVVPEGYNESFDEESVFSPRAVVLRVEALRVVFPRSVSAMSYLRAGADLLGLSWLISRCARQLRIRRASVASTSAGIALVPPPSQRRGSLTGLPGRRRSSLGLAGSGDMLHRPREPSVLTVASVHSDTSKIGRRTDRGEVLAVQDVSFALRRGDLLALLGHNGAGKSTTIKSILGLSKIAAGAIEIFGEDVRKRSTRALARLGVCPQHDDALWPDATPRQMLHLFAYIKNVPASDAAAEVTRVLRDVQLDGAADRVIGSLSGGMQRRVSLAIAALGRPELVILDEPSAGLDPLTRQKCWRVIDKLRAHAAVLLTTHDMEEADALASHLGLMHSGALVAFGSTLQLKRLYGRGYRIVLQFRDSTATTFHTAIKQIVTFIPTAMVVNRGEDTGTLLVPVSNLLQLPGLLTWLETQQAAAARAAAQMSPRRLQHAGAVSPQVDSDFCIRRFTLHPPSLAEVLSASAQIAPAASSAVAPTASSGVSDSASVSSAAGQEGRNGLDFMRAVGLARTPATSSESRAIASSAGSVAMDDSDEPSEAPDVSIETLTSAEYMPKARGANFCTRTSAAVLKELRAFGRDRSSLACQIISPVVMCMMLWMFHFVVQVQYGQTRTISVPSYVFPLNMNRFLDLHDGIVPHLAREHAQLQAGAKQADLGAAGPGNCLTFFNVSLSPAARADGVTESLIGELPVMVVPPGSKLPFPYPVNPNASGLLGSIDTNWCRMPSGTVVSSPFFLRRDYNSSADEDRALMLPLTQWATQSTQELDTPCNATTANDLLGRCARAGVPDGTLTIHSIRFPNITGLMTADPVFVPRELALELRYDLQVDDEDFVSYHRPNNFSRLGLNDMPDVLDQFPGATLTVEQARLSFMDMLWNAFARQTGLFGHTNAPADRPFWPTVVAAGNMPGSMRIDLRQFIEIIATVVLPIILALQLPAFALATNTERKVGLLGLQFRAGLRASEHLVATIGARVLLFAICNTVLFILCTWLLQLGLFTLVHAPSTLALIFLWGVWTSMLGTLLGLLVAQASAVSAIGFAIVIFANLVASMFAAIIFGNAMPGTDYTELPSWMFVFPQVAFVRALFRLTFECALKYNCADSVQAVWRQRDAAGAFISLLTACAVTLLLLAVVLYSIKAATQGSSLRAECRDVLCCARRCQRGGSQGSAASTRSDGEAVHATGAVQSEVSTPLLHGEMAVGAAGASEHQTPSPDSDDDNAPVLPAPARPADDVEQDAVMQQLENERWEAWCALSPGQVRHTRPPPVLVLLDVCKRFVQASTATGALSHRRQSLTSQSETPLQSTTLPLLSAAQPAASSQPPSTDAVSSLTGAQRNLAVDSVSLVMRAGECVAIIGSNGAGKTTLTSMIAGTLAQSSGTIRVGSRRHASDGSAAHRSMVGYCGQANVLWDTMTVAENVEYIARLRGFTTTAEQEQRRVLELVGLHRFGQRLAGDLSGGMKRRLCLALALVGSPAVLIADEPSAGLDPASRQRIGDVLQRVKQHCAVILVTHDMDEVRQVADRVALMAAGRFLFLGSLDDLLHNCGIAAMLRVTYSESHGGAARAFLRRHLPELLVWRASSTSALLMLPTGKNTTMSRVAQFMATRGPEGGISEWGIGACDANTAIATLLRSGTLGKPGTGSHLLANGSGAAASLLLPDDDDDNLAGGSSGNAGASRLHLDKGMPSIGAAANHAPSTSSTSSSITAGSLEDGAGQPIAATGRALLPVPGRLPMSSEAFEV